jgi:hypothetical protein
MQSSGAPAPAGLRGFGTKPLGRAILLGVAIVVTGVALAEVGLLIAIGTMLLLGLLLPIYTGWKRPRHLAIVGLVLILLIAPVTTALSTEMYRAPSPIVASSNSAPYGYGGSVLQNAYVTPFTGDSSTNFSFLVDVYPQFDPPNVTNLRIFFFVSSCPTATGNVTPPSCGSGYPYFQQIERVNHSATGPIHLAFNQQLPSPDVWWWTMFANFTLANGSAQYSFVQDLTSGYSTVQGPVTGSWLDTFGLILPQLYLLVALYLGIPFYVALLAYVWFKAREARRKGLQGGGAPAPGPAPSEKPGGGGATPASGPPVESHCPNCQAVVYPTESKCWKCGKPLPASAASSAPLPSSSGPSRP